MRSGFSLLTALIFLILVATISTLALTLSTQSAKQTTDIFLKNQAELLLRSGTEFAMLAMSGYPDYNTSCVENINIIYPDNIVPHTFDINISIMYLGSGLQCTADSILDDSVSTDDSNRTVIIDTIVSTNPNLTTDGTILEQIRLHRRSIQKP